MGGAADADAQGDPALYPDLVPDPVAVGNHHVSVLSHFWQPDRITNWRNGWCQLHGVCGAWLIMMAIVTNSYANVVSSFFGSKFNNSIEELLVSPTPNHIILLGFVSGGVSRGMLVAVIVTLVASLFVELNIHSYAVVVAVVALTSILFSLCGLINAVFANTFDDINIVPTFVLTPLTYLGGVFYSLELLPDFWATVSQANPLVYVVNAFRFGMLGVSDVSVGFAFAMIGAFTLVAYLYAAHLLRTGRRLRT